jgi:type I restriction-modification system DNA methylase subunit
MALFQQSVLKKYLADLPKLEVEAAFQRLTAHFGNPDIQENIRNAKEEQYQEGFLRELFVTVLGFTLHPQPNFNLITEQKNEKNSKKADGAILRQDKVIAVIELKSLKTTDLQSIELQAFGYKNNQAHCIYIVTSNFQKLRFYIENAIDFEEFDLFNLSKERFEILYLCLNYNNLLSDLPLRLKKASLQQEENITKKLYKDYSNFKQALFADVSARNRQHDKLLLYKKTQKLLDRFLFLFFAEDKGLLPPNTVQIILNQWEELKELDEYVPLYQRFQRFFGYLNVGHKSKHFEIFAYNGGLFAPDAVLDSLVVTDNLLYNHSRILSHYDFDTEVDTNILGHIFEHSLNELDEITALTEGGSFDKSKTKRKKDGIFYTPRYITKYIVAQTVGELCRRKQHEIGLNPNEISRATSKKVRDTEFKKINTYREWLLSITILDPACGSGAFLNEALSFLIDEHRLIDAMTATLFGDAMTLTDNVIQILENNIFGVDINEESVEIARLSLWLRTAKIGRKLNDLSKNIKVGNSLISDPSVAGDLAFEWQREFPQVFQKGGFDIVIGNPPYVSSKGQNFSGEVKEYFYKKYTNTAVYQIDTYLLFVELLESILNKNGFGSYIIPNSWLNNLQLTNIRKYILGNFQLRNIVNTPIGVFVDATVDTIIFTVCKNNVRNDFVEIYEIGSQQFRLLQKVNQERFLGNNDFIIDLFTNEATKLLITKIELNTTTLESIMDMSSGIKEYEVGKGNPPQTQKDKDNNAFNATFKKDETFVPHILGSDVRHYILRWQGNYLSYGEWLGAPRKKKYFDNERLIIREIPTANKLVVAYSNQIYTVKNSAHIALPLKEEYPIKQWFVNFLEKFSKKVAIENQ